MRRLAALIVALAIAANAHGGKGSAEVAENNHAYEKGLTRLAEASHEGGETVLFFTNNDWYELLECELLERMAVINVEKLDSLYNAYGGGVLAHNHPPSRIRRGTASIVPPSPYDLLGALARKRRGWDLEEIVVDEAGVWRYEWVKTPPDKELWETISRYATLKYWFEEAQGRGGFNFEAAYEKLVSGADSLGIMIEYKNF